MSKMKIMLDGRRRRRRRRKRPGIIIDMKFYISIRDGEL
jgi:hypothetical protein